MLFVCLSDSRAQTIIDLGDLPGGGIQTTPWSISSNGSVIAGEGQSTFGNEAFRWTAATGIIGLGELPGGLDFSTADGISADGTVVVGTSVSSFGFEAFRWTESSGMIPMGDLPGGNFDSRACAASADGAIIVGRGTTLSGSEAFVWTESTGLVGLGELSGGQVLSSATDVSSDGMVVVGDSNSTDGPEGFIWTETGGMIGLGDLPGGTFSSGANAVSADGMTVVGTSNTEAGFEAFYWTEPTGMVNIGDLPGGFVQGIPNAVSGDGSIVVGQGLSDEGIRAFIWSEPSGIFEFEELLNRFGVDDSEFGTLFAGVSISDDGRTIGDASGQVIDLHNLDLHWTNFGSGNWDDLANWTGQFFLPAETDHAILDPNIGIEISGPLEPVIVGELTVGTTTISTGTTTLELQPAGTLSVEGNLNIESFGKLVGNGTVNVSGLVFNHGDLDFGNDDLHIIGSVTNHGLIHGSGQIDGDVVISETGEIRVLNGQVLTLNQPTFFQNLGEINLLGGTIDSIKGICNDPDDTFVGGRGAIFCEETSYNVGLYAFSGGFADIFGDVQNSNTIVTSSSGITTFYDDVVHNGIEIRTSASSITTFFGSCSGSGPFTGPGDVFMEGDLRPGNSPASVLFEGNLNLGSLATTEIEIGGLVAGDEHDQLIVDGDLNLSGNLSITLLNQFAIEPGQQFTIIEIGGFSTGTFNGLNEGEFVGNFNGNDLFISYIGGDGNDVVLFTDDPAVLLGDVNLDGAVNLLDVAPFIDLLSTGTFQAEADVNQDGTVNLLDVSPFIVVLSGG